MAIAFRNYTSQAGITEDYKRVRSFLIKVGYCEYTYARWDWMTTHGYLDKESVGKIGIWEEGEEMVGLATYDCQLGPAYCITLPGYEGLKDEMLTYAKEHLDEDGVFGVMIADTDRAFQEIAAKHGLVATTDKENDAVFYPDQMSTAYDLPEGFALTSMKETYDLYQYGRVLWRGFNHEQNGEGAYVFSPDEEKELAASMIRPNVDLKLKLAVVAPDGNFVSYCGMWVDEKAGYAVIEPVATDPEYRRMGLGRAVVLEGIKRAGELGAKMVFVGSSQQFYYSIGMRPFATATEWKLF